MNDTLLSIEDVARETRHSAASVRRWVAHGVLIGGRRVKLAQQRVGGRVYVSRDALDAFHRACNPGAVPVPGNPSAAQRRRQAAADQLLRELGVTQ